MFFSAVNFLVANKNLVNCSRKAHQRAAMQKLISKNKLQNYISIFYSWRLFCTALFFMCMNIWFNALYTKWAYSVLQYTIVETKIGFANPCKANECPAKLNSLPSPKFRFIVDKTCKCYTFCIPRGYFSVSVKCQQWKRHRNVHTGYSVTYTLAAVPHGVLKVWS